MELGAKQNEKIEGILSLIVGYFRDRLIIMIYGHDYSNDKIK
jgi:hypothetical protein